MDSLQKEPISSDSVVQSLKETQILVDSSQSPDSDEDEVELMFQTMKSLRQLFVTVAMIWWYMFKNININNRVFRIKTII